MMTGLVDIGCYLKYLKWHLVKRMIPQKFITNIQKEKNELLEQDTKELSKIQILIMNTASSKENIVDRCMKYLSILTKRIQ